MHSKVSKIQGIDFCDGYTSRDILKICKTDINSVYKNKWVEMGQLMGINTFL